MLLQQRVAAECGVGCEEVVYGVACGADEGFVVDDGGYAEVQSTTLLQPLYVARAA